uniref:Helicase conserved C-terminal domain-containing protein n=1 Tax=Candidatus Kentrum sp. LFY TaxID=2126342 RepID=A0A450X1W6_9GAMM|nr:MAG: Helicase conserved C-terminal domain-containing protein [Candidatus Kentron sp. LFY]
MDDVAKIVGCWKALCKHQTEEERRNPDPEPMRRAVAFCQVIEPATGKASKGIGNTHRVSSKQIAGMFQAVVAAYQAHDSEVGTLQCQAEHVDGGMNASEKEAKLTWLRVDPPENTCRILSNVRCLSEGVDVPALDAVLFLTPRNSPVDVVQSVGRVMRNAPGKARGYVILPVVIPADMKAHEALADNRTYKVVWEVLQALRSHDDRFDAMINKMDLTGMPPEKMEIIAIDDAAIRRANRRRKTQAEKNQDQARGGQTIGISVSEPITEYQTKLEFEPGEVERAIYAKIVEKCGRRTYWEDWAGDIAKIAQTHITRIETIIGNPANKKERRAFHAFVTELRDDLNPAISEEEVIEMLAQHLITQPVFEALFEGPVDGSAGSQDFGAGSQSFGTGSQDLGARSHGFGTGSQDFGAGSQSFGTGSQELGTRSQGLGTRSHESSTRSHGSGTGSHGIGAGPRNLGARAHDPGAGHENIDVPAGGYSFAQNNPVSQGMQQVLALLHEHHIEKEADTLQAFYASVKMRAEGIDSAAGKQRIVLELYDKFFRNAFPRMTERLGIVYTPVEVETATKELSGTISIWLSWQKLKYVIPK